MSHKVIMLHIYGIVLILIWMSFIIDRRTVYFASDLRPLAMKENWQLKNIYFSEHAFNIKDDSTQIEFKVNILKDNDSLPVAYMSKIVTPVCDDSLCEIMHIELFWNLTGSYIGFDTISGFPFTKFDHLPYNDEDYMKLHQLLMDEHSIIRRKRKSDLFDETAIRKSETVDAVTGATAVEIRDAVVEGALWSCYTIYHIVYGEIRKAILADFKERYDQSIEKFFLTSDKPEYQLFALKKLKTEDYPDQESNIISIINHSNPLVKIYAMKKMPKEMWNDPNFQTKMTAEFPNFDLNTKSFILTRFTELEKVNAVSVLSIGKDIDFLTKNQLISFLKILRRNEYEDSCHNEIELLLRQNNSLFGDLVTDYLEENFKNPNHR